MISTCTEMLCIPFPNMSAATSKVHHLPSSTLSCGQATALSCQSTRGKLAKLLPCAEVRAAVAAACAGSALADVAIVDVSLGASGSLFMAPANDPLDLDSGPNAAPTALASVPVPNSASSAQAAAGRDSNKPLGPAAVAPATSAAGAPPAAPRGKGQRPSVAKTGALDGAKGLSAAPVPPVPPAPAPEGARELLAALRAVADQVLALRALSPHVCM